MRELGALLNQYQNILGTLEKKYLAPCIEACRSIASGTIFQSQTVLQAKQILNILGGSEADWQDWKWQQRNRINNSTVLAEILELSDLERKRIDKVGRVYQWAVTPYYLSLVGRNYQSSPIYKQVVPDVWELASEGTVNQNNLARSCPAPCITRKRPNQAVLNVTNQCAAICRHCSKRRKTGILDKHAPSWDIARALNYIRKNKDIHEVVIGGGDGLLLNDQAIDWILDQLHRMPHIETKRISTRVPVTLPQRITPKLCDILRRYPPINITIQFNHPQEVTLEARRACEMLAQAGILLRNQTVLLKGVNNNPAVIKRLNHLLVQIKVRPKYILQSRDVNGTRHFQTDAEEGLSIMEALRSSERLVPAYIPRNQDRPGNIKTADANPWKDA